MKRPYTFYYLIAAYFSATCLLTAQLLPAGFRKVEIAQISKPSALAFAPDGRIFVADKSGTVKLIKNSSSVTFCRVDADRSVDKPVSSIAVDPEFEKNNFVYVYYTSGDGVNRVERFTAKGDVAQKGSEVVLVEYEAGDGSACGELAFGSDGKLYISTGDAVQESKAQDVNDLRGKILRVNRDGSAPGDNPFSGSEEAKLVWASGLRNPLALDIEPVSGKLYVNDEGGKKCVEINDATSPGKNFGWPAAQGFGTNSVYASPDHACNSVTVKALSDEKPEFRGAAFFNPGATNYPDRYRGKYFFIDYYTGGLSFLDPAQPNIRHSFSSDNESFCNYMKTGPDGNLYFLNDKGVYKIVYTGEMAGEAEPDLIKMLKEEIQK